MKNTNRNRHHRRWRLMGWLTTRASLVKHGMKAFERDRAYAESDLPRTMLFKSASLEEDGISMSKIVNVNVTIPLGIKPWDSAASMRKYVETLMIPRPR